MRSPKSIAVLSFLLIGISSVTQDAHPPKPSAVAPAIPKTWDDEAIATLEIPLADPVGSPNTSPPIITTVFRYHRSTRAIPFMRRVTNRLATWIG